MLKLFGGLKLTLIFCVNYQWDFRKAALITATAWNNAYSYLAID